MWMSQEPDPNATSMEPAAVQWQRRESAAGARHRSELDLPLRRGFAAGRAGRTSILSSNKGDLMLVLTENATSAIRAVLDSPELPESAGLRITSSADEDAQDLTLALSPAPTPEPGDQVVETGGARVFLESGAAAMLENEVLDAEMGEGRVKFRVAHQ
jgi:iron-sulfur cluster assembly protein